MLHIFSKLNLLYWWEQKLKSNNSKISDAYNLYFIVYIYCNDLCDVGMLLKPAVPMKFHVNLILGTIPFY